MSRHLWSVEQFRRFEGVLNQALAEVGIGSKAIDGFNHVLGIGFFYDKGTIVLLEEFGQETSGFGMGQDRSLTDQIFDRFGREDGTVFGIRDAALESVRQYHNICCSEPVYEYISRNAIGYSIFSEQIFSSKVIPWQTR